MKKKTLVVGANSTLAKRLIKLIENENVVYKSFSNKKKLEKKDYNLNLNDEKSILNFSESGLPKKPEAPVIANLKLAT